MANKMPIKSPNIDDVFEKWFKACGTESLYISAGSTACAIMCSYLGGNRSGSIVEIFYGIDDNGNAVSGSGRIWLNP